MSQIVRSFAPKVEQEKCIGCSNCQLYCPEGTVLLTEEKQVIFDIGLLEQGALELRLATKDHLSVDDRA